MKSKRFPAPLEAVLGNEGWISSENRDEDLEFGNMEGSCRSRAFHGTVEPLR